jgi:hypothetical protein
MKKIALTILAGVVALTIVGCAANTATTTESGTSEPLVISGAVTEPAETAGPAEKEETTEVTVAPAESAMANADTENAPSGSAGGNQPAQTPASTPDKPTTPPASSTPPQTPAKPAPPTPTPTPTESPKPETPPPATPEPTDPPKPKTAHDAPYDTATIIADAKAYGESIGMTWSDPLTVDNCSWEAPSQTSSVMSGERLKTAIESGIRRVMKLQKDNEYQPGEFHFKLLLVPQGNGEYTIYWLMG